MIDLEDLPDCFYPMVIMEPIFVYHTKIVDGIKILTNTDMNPLKDEFTILRVMDEK